MPITVPTTQEIADQNLANYEGKFNQTVPLNDLAYIRVKSGNEARLFTTLDRFNIERTLQNFVLTATGDDLERIGKEYNLPRKPAESTELTISLPGTNGTVINNGTDFVGDANYQPYKSDESATIASGVGIISVYAVTPGVAGNLSVGDTLTISTQIPGAQSVATITVIDNIGAEKEDQEVYRKRLLNRLGFPGGGGNPTDYRTWPEVVAGVKAAYPYSGKPLGLRSYPMDRTVYVEAQVDIDPDGIAPQSLLDEARVAINTDPVLLQQNPALGSTDDTLYVESITRSPFFVEIRDLVADSDTLQDLKNALSTGVDEYFRSLAPFISGSDYVGERRDEITDVSVSRIVQDIMAPYGASAQETSFGLDPGTMLPSYTLLQGELAKSGGISYVYSS
jgi:hypothetical protein